MRYVCTFALVSLETVWSSVEDWRRWLEEPGVATGSGVSSTSCAAVTGKPGRGIDSCPTPTGRVFRRVFLRVLEMSTLLILHAPEFSFSD